MISLGSYEQMHIQCCIALLDRRIRVKFIRHHYLQPNNENTTCIHTCTYTSMAMHTYKMHMLVTYTIHLYSLIMMRFIGSVSSSQVTLTLSWNSVKFWAFSASILVDWQNAQQSGDCEDLQLLHGTGLPQTLPPALACYLLQGDLPIFVPKSETRISTNCVGMTCHMQDNHTKYT